MATQRVRSLLSLLVLMALAGGAGLFAYFGVHQKQEKEKAQKEKQEKLFPDLDKAKIAQLTVTSHGQTTVLAHTRSPEQWNLVSPVNALADKSTVEMLLDRLIGLKSKAVVEEKAQNLTQYGLATPALRIVAKTDDGQEQVLRAGSENSFDSSVYVMVGVSTDVLQAEGGFATALQKTAFDLRDKRVLPFEEADVTDLELVAGADRVMLAKKDGKWLLTAPLADRADEQAVTKLLGTLKNLRMSAVDKETAKAEDFAQRDLDKPALEVGLTLGGSRRMHLLLAKQDGRTWVRLREGTLIAEVPNTVQKDLEITAGGLRDKSLLSFDKDKVYKATFVLPSGDSLTLSRKPPAGDAGRSEDWVLTAPEAAEARKWKMNSVLWGLSSLKATGIAEDHAIDLAKYGLEKPSRTVTLFDEAGKEMGTVAFGKVEGEKAYARNAADTRVLEIDKARLGELPFQRADLVEMPKPASPDAATAK